ncbi:hypothetical protein GUJ93_ZPchr0006g43240 [Zizania palustris]|uniref:Uncharacterized protein n=1 Tax=Zizania palustris TaxID=103762 RepID=A0A8J5VNY8_ZIZPA|nr:hypothetical protein GUJ93_ZPchr0006g43240 [Zizania palustris]
MPEQLRLVVVVVVTRSGDYIAISGLGWLLVSEKLSKSLHLKKGRVLDVVGLTASDIIMDDWSELVQEVEQDMLETVLSRTNGLVLLLDGEHKGICGCLVEKNSKEETGLVELADTKDIIHLVFVYQEFFYMLVSSLCNLYLMIDGFSK